MSDPTMNREIEDVLSSIRRLVAQDRSHPAATQAPPPGATEPVRGALVLTPALRVVEGDAGAPPDEDAGGDGTDEAISFDSGSIRGDMVLAALGAVGPIGLSRRADDALDQAGGWTQDAEARPDLEALDHPGNPDEAAPNPATGTAEADEDAPPRTMADDLASLETTIAELEAAVAGIDEEFEADGGEADSIVAAEPAPLWLAPEEPVAVAAGAEPDAPLAEHDGADAAAVAAHEAESIPVWKHAAPEDAGDAPAEPPATAADRAVSARRLHLAAEAAGAPEDDAADLPGIADPHPAEDVPETSRSRIFVRRAPVVEAEPDVAPQPPAPASAEPLGGSVADEPEVGAESRPDAVEAAAAGMPEIDLETLRRLVAEVLRQELRGPLGERITQNVRKLVRREIHRVLDSRDFE